MGEANSGWGASKQEGMISCMRQRRSGDRQGKIGMTISVKVRADAGVGAASRTNNGNRKSSRSGMAEDERLVSAAGQVGVDGGQVDPVARLEIVYPVARGVTTRVEAEDVVTGASIERIRAGTADQTIGTGSAAQDVTAHAAVEAVIADAAEQRIRPPPPRRTSLPPSPRR